jgi:hypothetical protein
VDGVALIETVTPLFLHPLLGLTKPPTRYAKGLKLFGAFEILGALPLVE